LIWLGPIGTLSILAIPLVPVFAWFIFRAVKRTMSEILTPVRARSDSAVGTSGPRAQMN
jgi:hypothetical protein